MSDLFDKITKAKAENHWARPWVKATQALAQYRRGQDKEALALADHSLTFGTDGGWNRLVVAHVTRAMSLRRLGREEEARQALQSASQTIRQIKGLGEGDYTDNWHDYLIGQLLLHDPGERTRVRIAIAFELRVQVGMGIEVEHIQARVEPPHGADDRIGDRVVAAQDDGPPPRLEQRAHGRFHLGPRVGAAGERYVAGVAERAVGSQIDARFGPRVAGR